MLSNVPNEAGYYANFGGSFIPESLITPIEELKEAYAFYRENEEFQTELKKLLKDYVGRETPLTFAANLTKSLGGAQIYLKREDLAHTGSHKINNCLGQALLAKKMGKKRLIAETGAGQHGVATATAACLLGLECVVYMGAHDTQRQRPNVERMQILGAKVIPVETGSRTLKDAINEAMRDWVTNIEESYYLLGSVLGPHPYPMMVRDFQAIIGMESKRQILEKSGRLPDLLIACVGGGSNAMGLFYPFVDDEKVQLLGVEAGGEGICTRKHAARFNGGSPGVFQGTKTYFLQDHMGQSLSTHSISAGLDYVAVGPEHAYLKDLGRAHYSAVTDDEALEAFHLMAKTEGIIPALESSHAIAEVIKQAPKMGRNQIIIMNLSGRGDKDLPQIMGRSQ